MVEGKVVMARVEEGGGGENAEIVSLDVAFIVQCWMI